MRGEFLGMDRDYYLGLAQLCEASYIGSTVKAGKDSVLIRGNVIAIRGTDDYKDVFSDLLGYWYSWEYGVVHGGFYKAAKRLFKKIKPLLPSGAIMVTGHSRGAGIAPFLADMIKKHTEQDVYTVGFCSPCHGSKSCCKKIVDRLGYNGPKFINDPDDVIVGLPSLLSHAGSCYELKNDSGFKPQDHFLSHIVESLKKCKKVLTMKADIDYI